jgi:hypothetical protein
MDPSSSDAPPRPTHSDFAAEVARVWTVAREPDGGGDRVAAVVERVGAGLATWIGADGSRALMDRARAESPPDGAEGELHEIVAIAEILERLIGPELALRLIEQAARHPTRDPGRDRP